MEQNNWVCTVGMTMGDAAGIGPELTVKAALNGIFDGNVRTVIIGDERQLLRGIRVMNRNIVYQKAETVDEAMSLSGLVLVDTKALDVEAFPFGVESPALGLDAGNNLKTCVEACKRGLFDAVCFAPNNKAALKRAGFKRNGAVDLLAGFYNCTDFHSELSVLGNVWAARVTSHIPHKDVAAALSVERILDSARLLDSSMRNAGFENPRIAVAGLNPHNGESGTCGTEEIEVIEPAVKRGIAEKLNLTGPLPADTLFFRLFRGDFDGVLGMYHDQLQIALKLKGFDKGVTMFGGLPNPVTTCAHGTAFDIAGKGIADSGSLEHAFRLAKTIAKTIRQKRVELQR